MTGLEVLQSVEFLKIKGKQVAVLDVETWQALIEWLETLEDLQIAKQALNQLKAAGGNRDRADWLKWDDVAWNLESGITQFISDIIEIKSAIALLSKRLPIKIKL
jgi:hypothetical protein